jgi:DNA-directed RNA polymerase subunit K
MTKEPDTTKDLTRFEKARLVGARALQLAMGAPPLIELSKGLFEPFEIARVEFERNLIPILIVRL